MQEVTHLELNICILLLVACIYHIRRPMSIKSRHTPIPQFIQALFSVIWIVDLSNQWNKDYYVTLRRCCESFSLKCSYMNCSEILTFNVILSFISLNDIQIFIKFCSVLNRKLIFSLFFCYH